MTDIVRSAELPRTYRFRLSVDERIALEWGVKRETVHQWFYGHPNIIRRMCDVVRLHREAGEVERLARLLVPFELEYFTIARRPFDTDLLMVAVHADSAEDVSRSRYLKHPTDIHLSQWRKDMMAERATKLDLLAATAMEAL